MLAVGKLARVGSGRSDGGVDCIRGHNALHNPLGSQLKFIKIMVNILSNL